MTTNGWGDLGALLTRHGPDLTRLEVRYLRHRSFRWLVLPELLVGLVVFGCCCAMIAVAAVVVAFSGDGDLDLDFGGVGPAPRLWNYWQEIEVRGIVADGPGLVLRHTPRDVGERDAVVRQVLAHARRDPLVVVEGLGGDLPEMLQSWYGGQPLLAPPEERSLEDATFVLAQYDWEAETDDAVLHLTRTMSAGGRVWSLFALILQLAVLPLAIFDASAMDALRNTWWDVRGVPPGCWRVRVDHEALRVGWYRGDAVRHEAVLHRTDVIGVAYCPTLGFDRDVRRSRPRLAVVAEDETVRWPLTLEPREGRALRDALVSACITAWEGIPATTRRPTRCPWCSGVYVFEAGVPCPSCGGWPDRLTFGIRGNATSGGPRCSS